MFSGTLLGTRLDEPSCPCGVRERVPTLTFAAFNERYQYLSPTCAMWPNGSDGLVLDLGARAQRGVQNRYVALIFVLPSSAPRTPVV